MMKVDPHEYDISEPDYISGEDYWTVDYYKADKRIAFSVRVSDKMQIASINESNDGVFEGALTEKNNFH